MIKLWRAAAFAGALIVSASIPVARAQDAGTAGNDYPTSSRADYVFGCMATNGGNQSVLRQCSCAIDVIASIIPYSDYEKAETVLRMRKMPGGGYLAQEFRVQPANALVRSLEEAQAEADVRCF